jgi:hypothetical protein
MARSELLPIYKAALDFTVHMVKRVAGFSHYHKYTQGSVFGCAGSGELAHPHNSLRGA